MAEPVHSLFVPLSISVGLAVITAYALSSTIVPVLSIWLLKPLGIGKPQRASAATTQLLNFTQPHSTNAYRRRGRSRLLPSVSGPRRRFHLVAHFLDLLKSGQQPDVVAAQIIGSAEYLGRI